MANQTQMETMNGNTIAIDGDGIVNKISYKRNVVAKTADYTLKAEESGTLFTNTGATGGVNFTTPAVTGNIGVEYWFMCVADFELMITSGGVDTLVSHNDAAADTVAFTTATEQIGSGFIVVCDGTKWIVMTIASNDGTNPAQLTITT